MRRDPLLMVASQCGTIHTGNVVDTPEADVGIGDGSTLVLLGLMPQGIPVALGWVVLTADEADDLARTLQARAADARRDNAQRGKGGVA